MAYECEAGEAVGVVVCKMEAVNVGQNLIHRSKSIMAKILDSKIEGDTIVAYEGDEDEEIDPINLQSSLTLTLTRYP